jgi:hypothetical protein
MDIKIIPMRHGFIILACLALAEVAFAFQPYSVSLRRIKSTVQSIGKCDSLVLVSVDKHEINHGIATKSKDGHAVKKVEPKPVYHGVPVLEIATIKDRQAIQEIESSILNSLKKKPGAVSCVSWVGTLFIYTKNHETQIGFDDLTGIVWLKNGEDGYQAYGSATIWTEIMTKALGTPSIAQGPCHEDAKLSWNLNP